MALPVGLVLVAAGAWLLSQRALKPIETLTATVEQVTAKGLNQRITVQDADDEFARLITVFNKMMARLEKSFHQAGRFSADASHELKTPLAILQGQLEQALHAAAPGSEEQRRYETLAKEVQRLKSIVKKLLLLSRADAGELRLNLRPLNLSELLEGTCEDAEILAPHLHVRGEVAQDLWVLADPDLMKQVVQNLTTNAIKYNTKGGVVHVHLRKEGKAVRCLIANSGKGIAPEDRERIFTRFYRGDKARTRRIRGVGLGLSLAREIVRAHHGDLRLEDSPEGLTVFSMVLPRVEAGQP
jgi:signal transduction histidine kinase